MSEWGLAATSLPNGFQCPISVASISVSLWRTDAWLAWPVRVITLMAADLEVDDRKLVEVLAKYVRQHLDELGEPVTPELAPPG